VARAILESGRQAIVIEGGLGAWRKQGLPVERVPVDDILQLPSFRAT
jgi:rhodanese-related sulfurtransferase